LERTVAIDPIKFGAIWGGLIDISEESGVALRQTAFSQAVRDMDDYSFSLFDGDGKLVAQGTFTPGHLGSMPTTVKAVLKNWYPPDSLRPGDIIIQNDPRIGTGHFPDVAMIAPIFYNKEAVAYSVSIAHQTDIGGAQPGSQAVEGVYDMYQEGLHIPPVKLYSEDKPNKEIFNMIAENVRVPKNTLGDLRAQRNASKIAERRFLSLIEDFGLEAVKTCMKQILNRTEQIARTLLQSMPHGIATSEDFVDDSGKNTDAIRLCVKIDIGDDAIGIDWTGTDRQTRSGLNSTLTYTNSYTHFTCKCVLDLEDKIPMNEGFMNIVKPIVPPGSFLNSQPPAPVGARAILQVTIVDTLMSAFAKLAPERVVANSSHWANPTFSGVNPRTKERFVFYDMILPAWGGTPWHDGNDGLCYCFNASNVPIEMVEKNFPLIIENFCFIRDSAGPGHFRGGVGVEKKIRILTDEAIVHNLKEREKFPPKGLLGGGEGFCGSTRIIKQNGEIQKIHSKESVVVKFGDTVDFVMSGGGGYGDPAKRKRESTAVDVLNELVSLDRARDTYGVIINSEEILKMAGK
jgi:N-methylhydantoinase B